ncbi:hypothetical protein MesoLjLc_57980 [Mesorhizobium sp. L-8-10]|nr:hypothetical protein MesoLjLc_57980 [Mesorhizobium sp. L-8-10]
MTISEFVMSRKFFTLLTLAGIAASFASFASAADMASGYEPAGGGGELAYDWSGVYAGVQGGVQSKGVPNPFSSRSGWAFGGQVGANFQAGPLVYGGELDGTYSTGTDIRLGNGAEREQTITGAAKLRAGVSLDRTLIYGTAGYGWAKLKPKGTVVSDDQWKGGFVVGAGAEQAFAGRTSLKVEYLMHRLNDVESTVVGGATRSDDVNTQSLSSASTTASERRPWREYPPRAFSSRFGA